MRSAASSEARGSKHGPYNTVSSQEGQEPSSPSGSSVPGTTFRSAGQTMAIQHHQTLQRTSC